MAAGAHHSTSEDRVIVAVSRDQVVFPGHVIPVRVSEAAYKKSSAKRRMCLMPAEPGDKPGLGTLCEIVNHYRLPNGRAVLTVRGMGICHVAKARDGYVAAVQPIPPPTSSRRDLASLRARLRRMGDLKAQLSPHDWARLMDAKDFASCLSLLLPYLTLTSAEKLQALECLSTSPRRLLKWVDREVSFQSSKAQIEEEAKLERFEEERRLFLKEQLAAIKRELGEDGDSQLDRLEQKLADCPLPSEVRAAVTRELENLSSVGFASPEYALSYNYLQMLAELPWQDAKTASVKMSQAASALGREHWGLSQVKETILDHLAAYQRVGPSYGKNLIFVGPPGVGKTTLAKAVARALGRKFVRISLGGVRDEAEIRGHRKTYVGAMPGKVLSALRTAGTNNPVILLDELDKVSPERGADVQSALLELLDPGQNQAFVDHYLGVAFDLSRVFFIATANDLSGISAPLLDRLDVVELASYGENEKLRIATGHLIPRVRKRLKLKASQFPLRVPSLRMLIKDYTREPGVRELERLIEKLGRKTLRQPRRVDLSAGRLKDLLGPAPYKAEPGPKVIPAGYVHGLAYTALGGEVLPVEVALYEDSMGTTGSLKITGRVGQVMNESAAAALSCFLAHARAWKVGTGSLGRKGRLHVHFPDGGTPKDGPSAGTAILVALVSRVVGQPVPKCVGFTGEVGLNGQILPVGGMKEKILAATREGIRTVYYPEGNRDEVLELAEQGLISITVKAVSSCQELLTQLELIK